MTTSQNGWPASADRAEIDVKNYLVDGIGVHFAVAKGAAPLLMAFAKFFNNQIELISGGTYDDWGYAYRPVRGAKTGLSNHASGSAIDINAVQHPLTHENTFTPEQEALIRKECKRLGLAWGGDFKRRDEMHFEVAITATAAHALIEKLQLPLPKVKG